MELILFHHGDENSKIQIETERQRDYRRVLGFYRKRGRRGVTIKRRRAQLLAADSPFPTLIPLSLTLCVSVNQWQKGITVRVPVWGGGRQR